MELQLMRFATIKKTLKTDLQENLKKMDWNENNEKILMFLIISQTGDFAADMDGVSSKSDFKTHAQLLVVRESKITGRSYFCIDPQYIKSGEKSAPMKFLLKKPDLPCSENKIYMIHGNVPK